MASIPGRGAQVRLDGDAQKLARGAGATRLVDSLEAKAALERAGLFADGYTPDGSTATGSPAEDEALTPGGVVPDIGTVTTIAADAATAKVTEIAVPKAGGTMTGALTLATVSADDATKKAAPMDAVQAAISRQTRRVSTMANLRALSVANAALVASDATARLLGYFSVNDGGQGLFLWQSASTATDDGGFVIRPDSITAGNPGRWVRVYSAESTVTLGHFGARGDNTTDDTAAIQAAITAAETLRLPLSMRRKRYKVTATINIGLVGPVTINGGPGISGSNGIGNSTTFDFGSAPANVQGVVLGSADATRREGLKIRGLAIYKAATRPTSGSGSVGLRINGCLGYELEAVTTYGWDTGCLLTETVTGGGVPSGAVMRMCRFEKNGAYAQRVLAGVELVFDRYKFGEADYILSIEPGPSGGTPNGNAWRGGTMIAGGGTLAINCVRVTAGFYNTIADTAFEQASSYGVSVSMADGTFALNRIALILDNVWLNAVGGAYIYNANVVIKGGSRIRSDVSGLPALTYNRNTGTPQDALWGMVTGCFIGNSVAVPSTISFDRFSNVVISDSIIADETNTGLPTVSFTANSQTNAVQNCRCLTTHNPGYIGTIGTNIVQNRVGTLGTVSYGADATRQAETLFASLPAANTVRAGTSFKVTDRAYRIATSDGTAWRDQTGAVFA